jgi:hypothetical protein
MQDAVGIDMAAARPERAWIHHQLMPTLQACTAKLQKRQAAQQGKTQALHGVQAQTMHRGDGLLGQKLASQCVQTLSA